MPDSHLKDFMHEEIISSFFLLGPQGTLLLGVIQ